MVFPTIQQRFPNERNHNCRLSDHLTYYVAHNTLGVSYADLYCICVNRFNNKRKLNEVLQAMLGRNVDQNNFESDLKICQEYLMQLFPVFSKIAKIDHLLDDEEVEAIFVGFKPIYKKIKVELVDVN